MEQYRRADRFDGGARQARHSHHRARPDRPLRFFLHAARVIHGKRDPGRRRAPVCCRLAQTHQHHFFGPGSATTIATASPLGDTASRDTAARLCAETSKTSVQPLAPRVHEYTLVPPDIRIVLPSGIHVMSRSVLPSTTFVSASIFFVSTSICLIRNSPEGSRWTKLINRVPGMRCSERPMPLATTSPFPVFTLASCSEFGWPSTNNPTRSASTQA